MSIQGPNNSPIRRTSETPLSSQAIRDTAKSPAGTPETRAADQVEISAAARRMAGGFAPAASKAEIASRIAAGAYSSPEAAEALANRLLSSGDL